MAQVRAELRPSLNGPAVWTVTLQCAMQSEGERRLACDLGAVRAAAWPRSPSADDAVTSSGHRAFDAAAACVGIAPAPTCPKTGGVIAPDRGVSFPRRCTAHWQCGQVSPAGTTPWHHKDQLLGQVPSVAARSG